MKPETLGSIIKARRREFSLTQRELAERLGVKASYIAYLETGRRRPSLALLARIAETLDLGQRRLFLMSHPEAAAIVRNDGEAAGQRDGAWRKFSANRAMLARYKITAPELKVLKQVNSLGRVTAPGQFVFILNSIRQAMEQE